MTTRPSDPDYWYDPDKPAPVPEGMETTAEERVRWKYAAPDIVGSDGHRVLRDLDRALAELARLTAVNADLLKVNLSHAEALARLTALAEKVRIDAGLVDAHIRSCERIAREEEREACAMVASTWTEPMTGKHEMLTRDQIAAAIRARPTP